MQFIKIFLFSSVLIFSMCIPLLYTNAVSLVPCGDDENNKCTICDLALGIDNIVNFIVKLVVTTATLIIVVAGVMYIVSAGNQNMVSMAKSAMKNAVIGIIVVLCAFVIIHFVLKAISKDGTPQVEGVGGFGTNTWTFTCEGGGGAGVDGGAGTSSPGDGQM